MTEAEWLACSELESMLGFISDKASARKQRLFAVGCCRQIWKWIKHPACVKAVETSELFADGSADSKQLRREKRLVASAVSEILWEATTVSRSRKYAERDAARAALAVTHTRLNPAGPASLARDA